MYDDAVPVSSRETRNGPEAPDTNASQAEDEAHACAARLDPQEVSLVDASRQNRADFAPLYRRYVTPLYRYFYQQVTTREDAEDLTASTFSKALAGLDRYEARGSFAAWLFGIARHTLIDYQRARYAETDTGLRGAETSAAGVRGADNPVGAQDLASSVSDPAPGPETQVLRSEQAAYLRHLVATLPDEQREALVLRVFGGLRTRDVATVLGKSEGATKMLVHRAIEALRAHYSAEGQEAGS